MDKAKCKELYRTVKSRISEENIHDAKEIYQDILVDMSDCFNSYQSKVDEYFDFLIYNRNTFENYSQDIENEITRMMNDFSMNFDQKYALYMIAGLAEENVSNFDRAISWYKKAEEIHVAGFVKSEKSTVKIEQLSQRRKLFDMLRSNSPKSSHPITGEIELCEFEEFEGWEYL